MNAALDAQAGLGGDAAAASASAGGPWEGEGVAPIASFRAATVLAGADCGPCRCGRRWMVRQQSRLLRLLGSGPTDERARVGACAVTASEVLRALESGTAGLHVPTGEVRDFPTNTSDALTSGGTFAIAGAVQRMVENLRQHCGADPVVYMTGGAGWKMAPSMSTQVELVDSLIFDGLLEIADRRLLAI